MTDLPQIKAVLREYPPIYQPTQIEPLGAAGGMSGAQFWRIATGLGKFGLRCWPSEHPSRERLQFIHNVLFHAAERGISFLAVPIRTAAGASFVIVGGCLWELDPWMPGAADYDQAPRVEKLAAAMSALAKFHAATSDFPIAAMPKLAVAPPALARRLSRLHELAAGGTRDLSELIDVHVWPELEPLARRFRAMMPKALPRALAQLEPLASLSLPMQPCIRDIWHDHVLFTGDEVAGIIDFGALDIDTPATDIARLLGSLVGDDEVGWQAGLSAYSSIRPLSADEEQAAKALDASSSILAGCNWIQWICRDGREFEDHDRVIERFRQIVARCEFAVGNRSAAPGSAGGSHYQ